MYGLGHALPSRSSDPWPASFTDFLLILLLTFQIITGCVPYSKAKGEPQILLAISREEIPGRVGMLTEGVESDRDTNLRASAASRSLLSLVFTCWSFSPANRPKMREIVEQLFQTWDRNPVRHGATRIGVVQVRCDPS